MKFLLPSGLSADAVRELERTSVAGGQDNMPYPAQVTISSDQMAVVRRVDESGSLLVPWAINGTGQLMSSSATLMERTNPYNLLVELARGKVNQVRSQAADWIMGGLEMPESLAGGIHRAVHAFAQAIAQGPADPAPARAQEALDHGFRAAELLVLAYMSQVFHLRHQRQGKLDTTLGCLLGGAIPGEGPGNALAEAFHSLVLPLPWNVIEPSEGDYSWEAIDALVTWVEGKGLRVCGGPLIDFSGAFLPDWLWKRERDLGSLASFLCDYAETVIHRYRGRIRTWQVAAASNSSQVLAMGDEELLWLTLRLAEAARQIDPGLEIIISVSQPWGDYLTVQERTHSPFVFADTLIRSGLKWSGLDLEIVMGVLPRGSYCRDLLEMSRVLDLYALLGLPLQVTLGYPSSVTLDDQAHPDQKLAAGYWREGLTPEVQADWAEYFAGLALCKPYVRAVNWAHWSDADPHLFPHCGLVNSGGEVKPALQRLRDLRQMHLR